uniref:Secreted and transmembrane 1 n=1 Tax=Molossus molossus TaxID=27622 RepID=A0A7J8D285_MOLMO|nr:secreted and transmembrane 1 [Molossus molossus]
MLAPASSLPVPMVLWTLLMAVSLGAETDLWDNPICTKNVSVTRGERAVMTCTISNPFHNVTICRRDHSGQHCQLIFEEVTPRCTSQDGWHLWVQGHTAQLVTEEARDAQAGCYHWIIVGLQISFEATTLHLSEPPEPHSTASRGTQRIRGYPPQDPCALQDRSPPQDPSPSQDPSLPQDPSPPQGWSVPQASLHTPLITVFAILCVLVLGGVLAWCRSRRNPRPRFIHLSSRSSPSSVSWCWEAYWPGAEVAVSPDLPAPMCRL